MKNLKKHTLFTLLTLAVLGIAGCGSSDKAQNKDLRFSTIKATETAKKNKQMLSDANASSTKDDSTADNLADSQFVSIQNQRDGLFLSFTLADKSINARSSGGSEQASTEELRARAIWKVGLDGDKITFSLPLSQPDLCMAFTQRTLDVRENFLKLVDCEDVPKYLPFHLVPAGNGAVAITVNFDNNQRGCLTTTPVRDSNPEFQEVFLISCDPQANLAFPREQWILGPSQFSQNKVLKK